MCQDQGVYTSICLRTDRVQLVLQPGTANARQQASKQMVCVSVCGCVFVTVKEWRYVVFV